MAWQLRIQCYHDCGSDLIPGPGTQELLHVASAGGKRKKKKRNKISLVPFNFKNALNHLQELRYRMLDPHPQSFQLLSETRLGIVRFSGEVDAADPETTL